MDVGITTKIELERCKLELEVAKGACDIGAILYLETMIKNWRIKLKIALVRKNLSILKRPRITNIAI